MKRIAWKLTAFVIAACRFGSIREGWYLAGTFLDRDGAYDEGMTPAEAVAEEVYYARQDA